MASARGPLPNLYRLLDGRLTAAEYPGDCGDRPAREKLRALLDAGATTFIDLTEPHELTPYEALLAEEAGLRGVDVRYVRRSIPDVSMPRSPEVMREILDIIDAVLDDGGRYTCIARAAWGAQGPKWGAISCGGDDRRRGAGAGDGAVHAHGEVSAPAAVAGDR